MWRRFNSDETLVRKWESNQTTTHFNPRDSEAMVPMKQ